MPKTILVLAPHTDDAEFGCGGTIARLVEEKHDVWCAVFSDCRESLDSGLPPDTTVKECRASAKGLGIADDHLLIYDFPVRRFAEHRQGILETLVALERRLKPQRVFMPCINDLHQDHHVVASEGLRAFKRTTVLSYEMPWNNITFETRCFVELSKAQVEKKIAAVLQYKSQSGRFYFSSDFVMSLAVTRGTQIGTTYAEVFQIERLVFSAADPL